MNISRLIMKEINDFILFNTIHIKYEGLKYLFRTEISCNGKYEIIIIE